MINLLITFFLVVNGNIFAFEGDGLPQIMFNCDTVGSNPDTNFYSSDTKITFYGDSRMDYVNQGGNHGKNSMAGILNEPFGSVPQTSLFQDMEIQNFGASGTRSYNLLEHIEKCTKEEYLEKYRIGKRFVLSIGGNNGLESYMASQFLANELHGSPKGRAILPFALAFTFDYYQNGVRNDLNQVVNRLKAKTNLTSSEEKKDVLLIGTYGVG